ncbi:MAG TPA: hypothetical protein VHE77_14330 [Dongiaceae bacterium]|jgi:hypothetical protein|nr:hypothetical protein [Dongiaceae bacterium]
MIAVALAALKGFGIAQWTWTNRAWLTWAATGLVVAALAVLWRWERHDRIAAEAVAQAATAARDLARGDAERWRTASDQRDAALARLNDLIAEQNAAVARLRVSLDVADQAAAEAQANSRDAHAQLDQRIKELNDEAKLHPEDVAPLGRLVRGRVDRLWD